MVFVVSAAAALTESDCALLDAAAADTDAVIGVVSKIDVHRNWRDVLAADRDALAAHAPRYRDVPWVGVAALPDRGEPRVDDLVAAVREQLADADLARRNRLRAWESRLQTVADRYDRDADGAGRRARVEALREQRSAILRERRLSKSERTIALRSQTQQARVQLSYFARNRCASVRSELQEDAASLTRRKLPEFESYARGRINEVVAEVDEGTTTHLADVAQSLGLAVDPPAPAALPEDRDTGPAAEVATAGDPADDAGGRRFRVRCGVDAQPAAGRPGARAHRRRSRRVCGDRACADRLGGRNPRPAARSRIAGPLGRRGDRTAAVRSSSSWSRPGCWAAESSLTAALGEQDEVESARVTEQVGVIDTELREHAVVGARAAALRGREMPTLQAALEAVRAELGEPAAPGDAGARPTDAATGDSESDRGRHRGRCRQR